MLYSIQDSLNMAARTELAKKSLFFNSVKSNLILCQCLGLCSISNMFRSSYVHSLKCNFMSVGTLYQFFFVAFCEIFLIGGVKTIPRRKPLSIVNILTILNVLIFIFSRISDKKLLEMLKATHDADLQILKVFPKYYSQAKLSTVNCKWLFAIIALSGYLFIDFVCKWELGNCAGIVFTLSAAYRFIPFLSVVIIFCTMSYELQKRFVFMKTMLNQNSSLMTDYLMFEECRIAHCKLVFSGEFFCECFSIKITNQLLILTMRSVSNSFFPCFYGSGCNPYLALLHFSVHIILFVAICYFASGLQEKHEELLDALNTRLLEVSPDKYKIQIILFSCQVAGCPLTFSAFGFFNVDLTTVFAYFSVVLMYTIIAAQLADRLQPYIVA